MKKLLFVLSFSSIVYGQEWVTPVINGYGKIKYSKNVAVQPDNNLEYKGILFLIKYKIILLKTEELHFYGVDP